MYLSELEKIINKEAHDLITYLNKSERYSVEFEVDMSEVSADYVLCWNKDNLYLNIMLDDMVLYDDLDIQGKLLVAYYLNDFVIEFNKHLNE